MAISARAQAELQAFAEEAERAAAIGHEPWAASELSVSSARARTGQRVAIRWAVRGDLPAFLQLGADADWEAVPAVGQREIRIAVDDVAVALRAGPHRVKQCVVRALVPAPELAVFPQGPIRVPPLGAADVEVSAAFTHQLEFCGDPAGEWTRLPPRARVEIPDVWLDRVIKVRATGWEGTVLERQVRLCVAFEPVTAMPMDAAGCEQECAMSMPA